ncbi:MAG TPA: HAD hydrolase-like protein, partial [Candidatus Methylomirabilis sp.]|nr:HAD hydrolase-like protein [Candidatus Methylomirabilis sp.]
MRLRVDLVIFDLDGTLVDSRQDLTASVNHAVGRLGLLPLSLETVAGFVGDGVGPLLTRALTAARGSADEAEVEAGLRAFREHYGLHLLDATRPYPGVPEALQALGHKAMAVATNKPRAYAQTILAGLGLHHHFRLVLG